MKNWLKYLLIAVLAMTLLAAGGCGGGSPDSSDSTGSTETTETTEENDVQEAPDGPVYGIGDEFTLGGLTLKVDSITFDSSGMTFNFTTETADGEMPDFDAISESFIYIGDKDYKSNFRQSTTNVGTTTHDLMYRISDVTSAADISKYSYAALTLNENGDEEVYIDLTSVK